jgi:putative DNA primase/helicase
MMSTHEIEQWLGTPLFLVPQEPGTKIPMVKYTLEKMETTQRPVYRAMLEASNVAVRLGEHSGGLCAIDFDDDEALEQFLAVNPVLQGSARWKGKRGAQIGVRMTGKYPGPCAERSATEFIEVNGRQLGRPLYEWRSTGNLSTVKGVHPSGCEYSVLVDRPPVAMDFSQIRWPEGWPVPGSRDAMETLLRQHGVPWAFGRSGTGNLHARFFAGYMMSKDRYLWDAQTGTHYWYQADRGIWISMTPEEMARRALEVTSRVLLDQVASTQDPRLPSLLPRMTAAFADQVVDLVGKLTVERHPFGRPNAVVHTSNGMVDLRSVPYAVHGFGPEWMSRNQTPVRYVQGAESPMLQAFLDHALPEKEDQLMLQRWGGLALLQRNRAQVILVLTGTGGGGKSTVAGLVQRIVGEENCSELRTNHLGGRFEVGSFHDRTLLIGSDVAPDFLNCEGSQVLKALTGGDRLNAEFKGRNGLKALVGDWNVLVTANSKLKVNVQGDLGAWSRRLLLLDFSQPKPEKVIHNYHDVMIEKEGSGILNWFLRGAEELVTIMKDGKSFPVSDRQRAMVDNLLSESDSVRYFVVNYVRASSMTSDSITTEELYDAYLQMCSHKEWSPEPEKRFQMRAADLMLEIHQAMRSNHVNRKNREESGQRGFMKVNLVFVDNEKYD